MGLLADNLQINMQGFATDCFHICKDPSKEKLNKN